MKKLTLILTTMIILTITSCGKESPPDDGTPEPPALDGTFTSDYGTLTFNGDGRSITTDTTQEFEQLCDLPYGEHEGSYVFLFQNGEWRYDKAETFRIMIGDEKYEFVNDFTKTNENAIVITPMAENAESIVFEKK